MEGTLFQTNWSLWNVGTHQYFISAADIFYEKCESEIGQEKKEAVDALKQLISNQKIQTGYHSV